MTSILIEWLIELFKFGRQDPTEHVNLKVSEPALFESMRQKLLAAGKTLYQTNYGEPGTGPVKALGIGNPQGGGGSGKCISGPQVSLVMLSFLVYLARLC